MNFSVLHADTECDCLSESVADSENEYVRKLRKSSIEDKDFQTHWERELHRDETDCAKVCSYKAVSVNLFNSETEDRIIHKYTTTFSINPKKGAYFVRFRLKEDGGKLKHTPEENDMSHYDLYKADGFTLGHLEIVGTVKFG